jgi:hypothetical protein
MIPSAFELLEDHYGMECSGGVVSQEATEALRSFFDALSLEERQGWHAALVDAACLFHREFLNEELVQLRRIRRMAGNPN